jgi:hypothetical protein
VGPTRSNTWKGEEKEGAKYLKSHTICFYTQIRFSLKIQYFLHTQVVVILCLFPTPI